MSVSSKSVASKSMLAAALCLLAAAAAAQERSHTYLEAGYVAQKLESGGSDPLLRLDDIDVNGAYAAGSVELGSQLFLTGSLHKGSGDNRLRSGQDLLAKFDVDAQQAGIGLGYYRALGERAEWTAEVGYQNTRIEFENRALSFSDKLDGNDYRVSLGLRGDLAPNLEGWARVNYIDGDVYEREFSGTVGALLKFNELWGVSAEASAGAGNHRYLVGVRASF
ncbi:outer membrane beta-barrel protein [Lysobacter sp. K5869]|uniref:outer membrane beta-barrel protein n=1 Tax=Lysobacter sp. K5869 TaxID=2820808 RepID=UPI001C0641A6|nr:outer membrane beta-barrel protein [Lysobacter sp. K5869]QWP77365.1 outer membrane beta-barrel protein [Lysobacter sp. K5869]